MSAENFVILLFSACMVGIMAGILIKTVWVYPATEYMKAALEVKTCEKCGTKPFFLINRYRERWLVCQNCCGNHKAYSGEYEVAANNIDHAIYLWNEYGRRGIKCE